MSDPYLNRGETIILTTHRVSVGSILFDVMLTNVRLILMDSTYTRFEPRMILLHDVISVKGGKVPTGEPAIILTLEEPSDLSGSQQVNLIFTQQSGEQRTHDRELWIKKIIELVISAREKAVQKTIIPARKKTGMQPSVRRWVAPEPLRPHSPATERAPPLPNVVVTPEGPDSLEFSLKKMPPGEREIPEEVSTGVPRAPEILPATGDTTAAREADMEYPEPVACLEVQPKEPIPAYEMPEADEKTAPDEIPGAGPSISPEYTPVESLPAAIPATPALTEPAEDPVPSVPFASTVLAAMQSLQADAELQKQPEVDRSALPDMPEPAHSAAVEMAGHDAPSAKNQEIAEDRDMPGNPPVPDPGLHKEPIGIPNLPLPAQGRELPGTYTPDIPVTGITTGPQEKDLPVRSPDSQKSVQASRAGRPVIIAGALVLVALLVICGGILFILHYPPGHAGDNEVVIITPVITVIQTTAPASVTVPQTGVRVNVIYPGTFTGTVGNPGFLHQVSGTGNRTFSILMTDSIIQATIQKQENSGEALTVEIYNNSTLLSRNTVTAPMGEISMLIDTKTARPPGMTTPPASNRILLGNGTLIYY
jgi:hypothetical protein